MFEMVCSDRLRHNSRGSSLNDLESDASDKLRALRFDPGSLSLNDEYAPSFTPSAVPSASPSSKPHAADEQGSFDDESASVEPTSEGTEENRGAGSDSKLDLPVADTIKSGNSADGKSFMIEILLDNNFLQNAWHVFEGTGAGKKAIYDQDFGTLRKSGMHRMVFVDMPIGEYTFAIVDVGNDGISGGRISITQIGQGAQNSVLWERDGDFTFLVEEIFLIQ